MDYIINDNNLILKYPLNKVINIIKNISSINDNLTYCNNDNIQMISFLALSRNGRVHNCFHRRAVNLERVFRCMFSS